MTQKEKRIKIAKSRGWKYEPRLLQTAGIKVTDSMPWINPSGMRTWEGSIPDYFNDLNAMHEAEESLTSTQEFEYEDCLAEVLKVGDPGCDWQESSHYRMQLIRASAADRAEAFGQTLKLW